LADRSSDILRWQERQTTLSRKQQGEITKGGYGKTLGITQMSKKNNKKLRYPVFSMRLNKMTIEKLKEARIKSGKSWNLFVYSLIKKNEKINPAKSR
jgi:hypothetical protein